MEHQGLSLAVNTDPPDDLDMARRLPLLHQAHGVVGDKRSNFFAQRTGEEAVGQALGGFEMFVGGLKLSSVVFDQAVFHVIEQAVCFFVDAFQTAQGLLKVSTGQLGSKVVGVQCISGTTGGCGQEQDQ